MTTEMREDLKCGIESTFLIVQLDWLILLTDNSYVVKKMRTMKSTTKEEGEKEEVEKQEKSMLSLC